MAREQGEGEAERLRQLHLALLTAPLGRDLLPDETVVAVSPLAGLPAEPVPTPAQAHNPELSRRGIANLPPVLHRFEGACLTFEGYVLAGDTLIVDEAQFTLPGWEAGRGHPWFYRHLPFRAYAPAGGTAVVTVPGAVREMDVFCFNSANAAVNFGHFVHDFLLQLNIWQYVQRVCPGVVGVFSGRFVYPMQRFIVGALLGEEHRAGRFVEGHQPGRYRTVFLAGQQFPPVRDAIDVAGACHVRAALRGLAAGAPDVPTQAGERVYISRGDGTNTGYDRDLETDRLLEATFVQRGFIPVRASELTPETALLVFRGARLVAGLHGAGLLNILFSSHAAPHLLEIDAAQPTWRSIERFIVAAGIGHTLLRPQEAECGGAYDDLGARLDGILGAIG